MDDAPFVTMGRIGEWATQVPSSSLKQRHLDWLLANDVLPMDIIRPEQVMIAKGNRADDGFLDHYSEAPEWFALPEPTDVVYWRPRSQEIAWEFGRAFCLGQDVLENPATTALDQHLLVFADPLQWLQYGRRGIVVLHWDWAFEFLRDVQVVAVDERVLHLYRQHMKPGHLPELSVIRSSMKEAA